MPSPTLKRLLARLQADLQGVESGGIVVLERHEPRPLTTAEHRAWTAEHVKPIARRGRVVVVLRRFGEERA